MTSSGTKTKGFGMIELVLYVAVLTLMMNAIVQMMWGMIYGQKKINTQQALNHNLRIVSERIIYETRNSSGIVSVEPTKLSLSSYDTARDPTEFSLNNGKIKIGIGISGNCPITSPCDLTSNEISANSLNFTNLSSLTGNGENINFSLSLTTIGDRNEFILTESYNGSVEVRKK